MKMYKRGKAFQVLCYLVLAVHVAFPLLPSLYLNRKLSREPPHYFRRFFFCSKKKKKGKDFFLIILVSHYTDTHLYILSLALALLL
jgi:hypothetical protein